MRILQLTTISLLFCSIIFFVPKIEAQTKPFTIGQILRAIASINDASGNQKKLISNKVISDIHQRQVDFALTKENEKLLRDEGANDELIEIIRQNSLSIPTPLSTPLTYPEIVKDLNSKVPNNDFKTKAQVLNFLIAQIKSRGVEKSLSPETEATLRQSGANDELIAAIRQKFPQTFATFLIEGDEFRQKNDCERAIVAYTKAIELDAKAANAFYGRGLCYLMKADNDRSLADLKDSARLDGRNADTFFYLGVLFEYSGDLNNANSYYQSAARLKPELNSSSLTKCLMLPSKGNAREEYTAGLDNKVKECSAAISSVPSFLTALIYAKRALIYRLQGEYDKGIADYEKAIQLKPQFSAANTGLSYIHNERGLFYYKNKDSQKAFDDFSQAIKLDTSNAAAYANRSSIHITQKDFDNAIADCNQALRLSNNRIPLAYNNRGFAYEMKGDAKQAVSDYNSALKLDPQYEPAKANLNRLQIPTIKKPE